jgi:hypothetical protein
VQGEAYRGASGSVLGMLGVRCRQGIWDQAWEWKWSLKLAGEAQRGAVCQNPHLGLLERYLWGARLDSPDG